MTYLMSRNRAKLTGQEVIQIYRLTRNAVPHAEIAAQFGTSIDNVGKISSRQTWTWLLEREFGSKKNSVRASKKG